MMFAIPFPAIDPVLISIGPLAIRWYSLAYIAGILLGWRYIVRLSKQKTDVIDEASIDDLIVWLVFGIILGGRLGYVLFYKLGYYMANPVEALYVWEGGMSFHGGAIGVMVAVAIFCRKRGISFQSLADMVACAAPIGIFFGRIANFINGELFGRTSDVSWAMVFPRGGPLPRHPSQIYEAILEGLVLFVILAVLWRFTSLRDRPGALGGAFLLGYGVFRLFVEQFRQPDAHLGFLIAGATMGQLLSLPLIVAGGWLLARKSG